MSNRNYALLVGETLKGFEVETILRYENNEPVYGCRCLECGTSGVPILQKAFRQGNPRCVSSKHQEVLRSDSETLLQFRKRENHEAGLAAQQAANVQRAAEEKIAQERAQAAREEARLKPIRDEWRRYALHSLNVWHLDLETQIVKFDTWVKIRPEDRQRIMAKVDKEISENGEPTNVIHS